MHTATIRILRNSMLLRYLSLLASLAGTGVANDSRARRAQCASEYSPCDAEGSTDARLPAVGAGLRGLYKDIVDSVNAVRNRDTIPGLMNRDESSPDLCCKSSALLGFCHRLANLALQAHRACNVCFSKAFGFPFAGYVFFYFAPSNSTSSVHAEAIRTDS
jgi:hypothetical protein